MVKVSKLVLWLLILLTGTTCDESVNSTEEDQSKTLSSFTKINTFPFYSLHYYGDYDLSTYLPAQTNIKWGCSCLAVLSDSCDVLMGRNFDWYTHPILILFTDPPDRYASVSMVDISYLGFGFDEPSKEQKDRLLETPYMPFDGMNERGLAIGMMAVPHGEGGTDPSKQTIGSLLAIRLVLDCAKNVNEAVNLLEKYNIDFEGGPPVHYILSDNLRNSVVVEFLDDTLAVIERSDPWQVSTNFLLAEERPVADLSSCWRYNALYSALRGAQGNIDESRAMDLLSQVSQQSTIWSVVYNETDGGVKVVTGRRYDAIYDFEL
jgi:hypothetical protein